MLKLLLSKNQWGINLNPTCLQLQIFMRLNNIPYDSVYSNKAPLPLCQYPTLDDQGIIINSYPAIVTHLERKYELLTTTNLNNMNLTAENIAFSHLTESTLTGNPHWTILYSRILDFDNWRKFSHTVFGPNNIDHMRALIFYFQAKRQLQHINHLNSAEIYARSNNDINNIATILADKTYLLGDHPTTIDAALCATLASIIIPPLPSPLLDSCNAHPNLINYFNRITKQTLPMLLSS